jgi:outer membrane protein OmpA-like peptidoglycan-associated protein
MAELLRSQATLRVHIVGHTDNVGSFEANLALSQERAQAVVAALVSDYRIDAKRLAARGVASLSPVASNLTDEGKAKNRRVELVQQ